MNTQDVTSRTATPYLRLLDAMDNKQPRPLTGCMVSDIFLRTLLGIAEARLPNL
jgi:hypothetical protein